MRINKSTGYAFLAVGYIAQHQNENVILSKTISKEFDIPLEYLLKVMKDLVKADLLKSKRGPRGGFSLARPTEDITMLNIIEAVEGPIGISLDLEGYSQKNTFGMNAEKTYSEVTDKTRNAFDAVKLSDLISTSVYSQTSWDVLRNKIAKAFGAQEENG
ncbi:MAG: RrF2 family transcriptional regulator [Planctomycetota bacterium]|jgi:Rrf2 family protein